MRTLRRVLLSLLVLSAVSDMGTEMPTPEGFSDSLLHTTPTAGML
jgi:hypothetical protein